MTHPVKEITPRKKKTKLFINLYVNCRHYNAIFHARFYTDRHTYNCQER